MENLEESLFCNYQENKKGKVLAKLLKLYANAIPKKKYFMLRKDAENNISYNGTNWVSQVKSLLDELGLTYIWVQQNDINIPCELWTCTNKAVYKY